MLVMEKGASVFGLSLCPAHPVLMITEEHYEGILLEKTSNSDYFGKCHCPIRHFYQIPMNSYVNYVQIQPRKVQII